MILFVVLYVERFGDAYYTRLRGDSPLSSFNDGSAPYFNKSSIISWLPYAALFPSEIPHDSIFQINGTVCY